MPTNRGYDSFFGYLSGMQDHFTEQLGGFIACKTVVDLTEQDRPAPGDQNGTYSGWLYNRRAVQVIDDAAAQRRRWLAARAAATAATAPLASATYAPRQLLLGEHGPHQQLRQLLQVQHLHHHRQLQLAPNPAAARLLRHTSSETTGACVCARAAPPEEAAAEPTSLQSAAWSAAEAELAHTPIT
jgi:hypothetical protein